MSKKWMHKFHFLCFLSVLLLSCSPADTGGGEPGSDSESGERMPHMIYARETPSSPATAYSAWTMDLLDGFVPGDTPAMDLYGGWKVDQMDATGNFRVEFKDGRWWLVSPEGHPFVSAQAGNFVHGNSDRQKALFSRTFVTEAKWASSEINRLKQYGFTGVAGSTRTICGIDASKKIAYCVYANPMATWSAKQKKTYPAIPVNMPVVFDTGYDDELSEMVSWLGSYAHDPFCMGINTDDELYWTDDMLKLYLEVFPSSNPNRVAAQRWLDERKGRTGSVASSADAVDKDAFKAYCLEEYLRRTSTAVRKALPGKMYLGTRFYKWAWELSSEAMMKVAGKYTDVICVNHFTKWEPSQEALRNWFLWSGRPVMITSFDVKGEDAVSVESGLTNEDGLGWIVPTQEDRGVWYENFVIGLVRSGVCIGWQWYTYQDNDPEDFGADASNRNSNKGIVSWDFKIYEDLASHMKEVNSHLYDLCIFYKLQ